MEQERINATLLWLRGPGVYPNGPAAENVVTQLQKHVAGQFGRGLPKDYISFLRLSDGLQIENASFIAAADVAGANADAPAEGMVRIGGAGNIDDFLIDMRTNQFLITEIGRPNEVWSTHKTFRELLHAVAEQQGVVRNT